MDPLKTHRRSSIGHRRNRGDKHAGARARVKYQKVSLTCALKRSTLPAALPRVQLIGKDSELAKKKGEGSDPLARSDPDRVCSLGRDN